MVVIEAGIIRTVSIIKPQDELGAVVPFLPNSRVILQSIMWTRMLG